MPYCSHCGKEVSSDMSFCPACGAKLYAVSQHSKDQETTAVPSGYDSGKGGLSQLPPEIKGWNWGAFLLGWIWGIGNNTYISLLTLIPFVNIVVAFFLGAKGNEWAWQNKIWKDVNHFKTVQYKWAFGGVLVLVVFIIAGLFLSVINQFSEPASIPTTAPTTPPEPSPKQTLPSLPEQPLRPANITVAELTANPTNATWNDVIIIQAKLINTGDVQGTYLTVFKLNDEKKLEKSVTIPANGVVYVNFPFKGGYGYYTASVGDKSVDFTVWQPNMIPPEYRIDTHQSQP